MAAEPGHRHGHDTGSGPGDLDYEVATDGSSFTLSTSLTDGSIYTQP